VYRYYYYRTSPRHYYYYYGAPRPYAYPVYYLVPYHVHTTPGYHNHGEQANYCSDGYRQGGVYTGGAYTRGASHQAGGAILGGLVGAAVGSQVGNGKGKLVAVGVGTVIGALVGSDVGRAMDERDRAYATGSFGHAMETSPTCTTITWNNQQTGNYGSVTPVQTYEPEPGRYCREFQQQVMIGGNLQDAYGTACRQPDGSWEIVAEQP
jgi:surface antigen